MRKVNKEEYKVLDVHECKQLEEDISWGGDDGLSSLWITYYKYPDQDVINHFIDRLQLLSSTALPSSLPNTSTNAVKDSITTTINDIGIAYPHVSSFVAALNEFGLDNIISRQYPFTLFIPTNTAFKDLNAGDFAYMGNPANFDKVQNILKYHFVQNLFPSSSLENGDIVTLTGDSVTISVSLMSLLLDQ